MVFLAVWVCVTAPPPLPLKGGLAIHLGRGNFFCQMARSSNKESDDYKSFSMKLTKGIRNNILSGRWMPETKAEREMLEKHLAKKKRKR